MKKLFLFLSFLLILFSAGAQDTESIAKFQFGMKASPGICWLKSNTKNTSPDGSLLRASYGFIVNYKLSNNYFLATGINAAYKGGKLDRKFDPITTVVNSNDSTVTVESFQTLRTAYVELPVTMLMKTKEIGYIKYFLQVGVAPGINLRANYDETTQTKIVSPTTDRTLEETVTEEDIAEDINLFNLSMQIGGGIEYNLSGSTSLTLGLSFSNGLIKITDKKAENDVLKDSKLFSNLLSLDIGILF
ncbi:MAG: hypothetical protein RL021_9 [Bacteroidota bacterium]|jgi:opacity protein-like surface antigen